MNISVPDDLAEKVRELDLPTSRICQDALRVAVDARSAEQDTIKVDIGEDHLTVGFTGRWLVEPDSDRTRSGEEGQDAGAYWGVALTKRDRIAVFTAHCNERWPARLDDYDSLYEAGMAGIPADILALAARELGQERTVWMDI